MRIAKFIALCGITSRRKASDHIEAGRIRINGRICFDLNYQVRPGKDIVTLDKKTITINRARYIVLNKPVGYLCTKKDEYNRKTVYDIVRDDGLFIAGRLDINSEGLVFMSNDGEFINFLTHPRNKISRIYRIKVRGLIDSYFLYDLKGKHEIKPETYSVDEVSNVSYTKNNTWFDINIHEGKKREIRNLTKHYGLKLVRLIRLSLGPFTINNIEKGRYIEISSEKIENIKRQII